LVSEELREDVSRTKDILGKLSEMICSILDVARLEEEKMPIERIPSDVLSIARAAIERVKGPDAKVSLSGDGSTRAACDPSLITRVIGNLVSHTPASAIATTPYFTGGAG
jgi:signal transduction histidine kinase